MEYFVETEDVKYNYIRSWKTWTYDDRYWEFNQNGKSLILRKEDIKIIKQC